MRSTLHAVHDDDLDEFLDSLDLREDIENGKLKCVFCGDVVTEASLSAVLPKDGTIKVVCPKPKCMKSLADYLYEN